MSEYLNTTREAELLVTILMDIEPSEPSKAHGLVADRILCDLIEMGLADMDAGPAVYQAWMALGDPEHPDFDEDGDEDADRKRLTDLYCRTVS
jgi:hypothetical protein